MPKIFFPSSKPRFVNEEEIIKALKKLALEAAKENKNIEAVYLFGSYAQGAASLHSDADILVILSQDRRNFIDRLDEFILAFSNGPIPVDILVYTRQELEEALKKGNRFLAFALTGIKIFATSPTHFLHLNKLI